MSDTKRSCKPGPPDSAEPPPARVKVIQQVGEMNDSKMTGVSIGQMRDAIFHIQQRALTAEEVAERAADIELGLLAQGVHRLAQRLAVQVSAGPEGGSPYKGLLAYGLGDAERFYGRAEATAALLDLLRRGRLAVLHAESGAGKSSILQAGIAAHLIGSGHLAVYLRPYRTAPATAIKEAFLDLSRAPRLAGLPLRDFLRYVTDILDPGETLYLLLDQLEEFFAYLDPPARAAFSAELGECLHDESLNVRWLVALRGEALSRLAEMEAAGVEPFENEYRLARLTRDEAREAMTGPGFAFEPGLVETMLDALTNNGEVVPPQLQLVCLALTEGLTPPAAISREQYDCLGGAEGILCDYLVRQVGQFPAEEREPVRRLLRTLVTAEGRRAVLAYPDLLAAWQVQGGERAMLDMLLARLVERRLLVTQERTTDGERTYELAHDYLLREIQLDPAEQARKAVQEMLDHEVLDYRANPRMLLDEDKFDAINARRKELVLSSEAAELLRKSEAALRRRRTLVRGGAALVAVLAVIAVVLVIAIFGAQQRLGQTQNKVASRESELARVSTEAADGRATQLASESTAIAARATSVADAATAQAASTRAVEQQKLAEEQRQAALALTLASQAQQVASGQPDQGALAALLSTESLTRVATFEGNMAMAESFSLLPKQISRMTHDDEVWAVAFSPDGSRVVSGSADKTARVWDAATGREIARMPHDGPVLAVAFSPDGRRVVSGSQDKTARVWDAASGREITRMRHDDYVSPVAFSPDGSRVVSGSDDKTARVWDAATGREIARMTHDDHVSAVAFSPDGRRVVSGSADKTARVWDAATGREIARMTHDNAVFAVAFSPDARWVVSGSVDRTARVWDAASGREIARMTHDDYVSPVAFSPDGRWVVSGSADKTARVWDAATGREVARMTHDGLVHAVAFSPDGRWVVSGSGDNTARVWRWRPEDLIAEACARLDRNLTRAEWQYYLPGDPYRPTCPNLPPGE